MDIGDILVAIFIVSGILSSLAGGKKKKKKQQQERTSRPPQPRPHPRSSRPPSRERAGTRPSLDPSHSGPVPTQMEEILRQLGLEVEPEREEPEIEKPAVVVTPDVREYDPVHELPPVVPQERPVRRDAPSAEARHTAFHDEYIDPFEQIRIARPPSRAKQLLTPESLRQAMLLREILRPPKGLR